MFDTIPESIGRADTADLAERLNAVLADVVREGGEEPGEHREAVEALLGTGLADLVLAPTPEAVHPAERFCDGLEIIAAQRAELAESVQLQAMTANTVRRHARPELWRELGAGMRSGAVMVSSCLSEAAAGSDMSAIGLAATREDERYRLTGEKNWVAHAPFADQFIVYARTGGPGLGGISAFLVDATTPGVTVAPPVPGLEGVGIPVAPVSFDDVVVPAHRMLGRRDRGARVIDILITQGRLGLAAAALGLATAALRRAVEFAGTRVRFGQPVIEHQGIAFPLADMATSIRAARALLAQACAQFDRDPDAATVVCAQAKLFATETAAEVTAGVVRVLGADSYRPDEPVERWMRQAQLLCVLQGTNQMQRRLISSSLGGK